MNLFWKRIPKTANYEQDIADRHELYHVFIKTEKSALLSEYKEFAEIDFNKAKKQFKKKEDYLNSELAEKEKHFNKLQQDSDIKNYLKYEKSNAFDFSKQFKQFFTDDFSVNKLDSKKWINAYRWSYNHIKGSYSNPNEFQAYTEGENTEVIDGQLHLITKRKDAEGRVWNKENGFVLKPFKYTSDLISGENHLTAKGCIQIKFKTLGASKSLQHFIRIFDDKNQRSITLMESVSKRKFRVGRSSKDKKQSDFYSTISGKNLEKDFHLLELEWNSEVVIWRLNGYTIHQDSRIPNIKDMHLCLGSCLLNEKGNEGKMIVDYIRIFKDRS